MKRLFIPIACLLVLSCSQSTQRVSISASGFAMPPVDTTAPLPEAIELNDLSAFDQPPATWQVAEAVYALPGQQTWEVSAGSGALVHVPEGQGMEELYARLEHGDLELSLEFLLAEGAEAGLLLQSRYELLLSDSWPSRDTDLNTGGALKGTQPPGTQAMRAPGLWQQLSLVFRAPDFDARGEKTRNARFEAVALNGSPIHEQVFLQGPTPEAPFSDETDQAPLLIRARGGVAFRNIRYRELESRDEGQWELPEIQYTYYEFPRRRNTIGNLSQLTPTSQGTIEHLDIMGVRSRPNNFAIRFRGEMNIPQAGTYTFFLSSDDGSKLYVDNNLVVDNDGVHGKEEKRGTINLGQGSHLLQIEYLQVGGDAFLQAHYEGPGIPKNPINQPMGDVSNVSPLLLEAREDQPYLLRSFVMHAGEKRTHAISVGDPAGLHYTLDLEQAAWLKAWRGDFVDVGNMWVNRGIEQIAVPQGPVLELPGSPSVAYLESMESLWPDTLDASMDFELKQYVLDEEGRPTFTYSLEGVGIEDKIWPAEGGKGLTRHLSFGKADQRWARLARGASIEALPDNWFRVDDGRYFLHLKDAGGEVVIREFEDVHELLVGRVGWLGSAEVTYTLLW